jgi:hypothetical protein
VGEGKKEEEEEEELEEEVEDEGKTGERWEPAERNSRKWSEVLYLW